MSIPTMYSAMADSYVGVNAPGSQLALFQAHLVARRIAESGGSHSEIIVIKTSGDQLASASAPGVRTAWVKPELR